MVTFVALALWCTLLLAPGTPIGRAIRLWTVEKPAARLARITRGHVLLVLLVATGTSLLLWLIGHEAVRLAAMGLPDLMAWATMFEVTAYLDTLAAMVIAASAARFGAIKASVRATLKPRRPMARTPRRARTQADRTTAANDDEDHRATRLRAA